MMMGDDPGRQGRGGCAVRRSGACRRWRTRVYKVGHIGFELLYIVWRSRMDHVEVQPESGIVNLMRPVPALIIALLVS